MAKDPRVCDTCPWLKKNHGKRHAAGWYRASNLRRLWNGLRTGNAPGMICHSTDPNNKEYGGDANIVPGHENECGGALMLVIRNVDALNKGETPPVQPSFTRSGLAHWIERHLFGGGIRVDCDKAPEEIGVPWTKS